MGNFEFDKELTQTILAKRAKSQVLTPDEEKYAHALFEKMISGKKFVRKTVTMITGTELRKGMFDAKPIRDISITPATGSKTTPQDNPTAQPDASLRDGNKLPDLDNKPNKIQTENERIADILQTEVGVPDTQHETSNVIQPEPAAKFVSADPVKPGDMVVKNFAKVGQQIVKGTVHSINTNGVALVKWANGLQTHEVASYLVKMKLPEADPSVKDKDYTYEIPVSESGSMSDVRPISGKGNVGWGDTQGKMSKGAISHTEAYERVKDQPGVEDPHALAQHIVEEAGGEKEKVKKDGDIVGDSTMPQISEPPFQGLVATLEQVLALARCVKSYQVSANDDEEVVQYYDTLLDALRGMAEKILAALQMELTEAQEKASE